MAPKNVQDVFGTRIAKRYVAIQVTVANRSDECAYLVHDASLDVTSVISLPQLQELRARQDAVRIANLSPELRNEAQGLRVQLDQLDKQGGTQAEAQGGRTRVRLDEILKSQKLHYEVSSEQLSIIQGVAEKGQVQDIRNRLYRYLRAAGTIAGGITGVAVFGNSFAPAVAAFNGPMLTAYSETFPDFTINQLIRLNASTYQSNRLVPKQQALVFVSFIPQAIFMDRHQANKFFKDPLSIKQDVDFRQIEVLVDGNFITELPELEPAVTTAVITPGEMTKFGGKAPVVRGSILGQNLSGADVRVKDQKTDRGLRARLDGPAEDKRLNFIVESDVPVPPKTEVKLEVVKNQIAKDTTLTISYDADPPVLQSVIPTSVDRSNVDTSVTITLAGKNFMSGDNVQVDGAGVEVERDSVVVKEGGTSLAARLTIRAGASAGIRNVTVATSRSGKAESSKSVPFEVKVPGGK
jgi:hypothetical protein